MLLKLILLLATLCTMQADAVRVKSKASAHALSEANAIAPVYVTTHEPVGTIRLNGIVRQKPLHTEIIGAVAGALTLCILVIVLVCCCGCGSKAGGYDGDTEVIIDGGDHGDEVVEEVVVEEHEY